MMIKRPSRLQGTDGVRGKIVFENAGDPVLSFLTNQVISPLFFEVYCYSFGLFLKKQDLLKASNTVILGWDPRDSTRQFIEASISGLRKAGLDVIEIGILPTPAIPLYAAYFQAAASVMLTASHNPSDQNGIKLFLGEMGMKLLTNDDELLTQFIYELDYKKLPSMSILGSLSNSSIEAGDVFFNFSVDLNNTGLAPNTNRFKIIIDAANGSFSEVSKRIFDHLFAGVVYTNCSFDAEINENSGVADIEGLEQVIENDVKFGGIFEKFDTFKKAFELSKSKEIQNHDQTLITIIFDGDGDRCFVGVYIVATNTIQILSGDALALLQSIVLRSLLENINEKLFINTIESDISVSINAGKLGFKTSFTEVGDKWILNHALKSLLDEKSSSPNSASELVKTLSKQKSNNKYSSQELQFQIGFEESGHCLTTGTFKNKQSEQKLIFLGNGVKTALNSISSLDKLLAQDSLANILERIIPDGVKETLYIYRVNKFELQNEILIASVDSYLSEQSFELGLKFKKRFFANEPEMVFYEIIDGSNELIGTLFARNSGTEDKTSVYLRCVEKYRNDLLAVHRKLQCILYSCIKNYGHEDFVQSLNILKTAFAKGFFISDISSSTEGLIKILERKEKLIFREEGRIKTIDKIEELIHSLEMGSLKSPK